MERELLSTDKRETPSYRFESCPDYKLFKIKNMEQEKLIHLLFTSETPEQLEREFEGESDEEIQIEKDKNE